ncbi:uroporphyrinogen-III synthase [Thrips palmi]|uniref:Uroporphyrinogen-III synthase n=1 Tax=Thrips palmi TaxID=161013 RepID=A0A6P9A8C1_THRPL|nr:uroporphyrinogen-III synthase [Thrips palmi]
MKILVLKAPKETAEDGDPYVNALRNVGLDADGLEVLSFQYVNQDLLREKVLDPKNYGGFIFTSPRGVVAVEQCLKGTELGRNEWSSVPAYVVGEGTGKVLWEKFEIPSVGQDSGSAQKLAHFIRKEHTDGNRKPLLFPSADLKRNALQEMLTEAGISVDVVTSYKTIPHPHLEAILKEKFSSNEGRPDVLVFFSPSGVNAVLSHPSDLQQCKVVAIGPTTEAALKDRGMVVFATAENPSPTGLVEAIQAALKKTAPELPHATGEDLG